MPIGVVVRRSPGTTRWAKWVWRPVAVLPGAGSAQWKELRRDGDVIDYHAGTVTLDLHRTLVEGYKVSLAMAVPSVFVVMRPAPGDPPLIVHTVTASAYEAQDHTDNAEDQVEPVPMPKGLRAWIAGFADSHFREDPFVKRRRDRARTDLSESGIGDARVRQAADVYRAPRGAGENGRSS